MRPFLSPGLPLRACSSAPRPYKPAMTTFLNLLGRIALATPLGGLAWFFAGDHPIPSLVCMALAFAMLFGSDPAAEPGSFWAGLGDGDGGDGGDGGGCGGGCGGG